MIEPTLLKELLTPFEGEKPCGVDIREDETLSANYYQLKDQRNQARKVEKAALLGEASESPLNLWQGLAKECLDLLKQQTKDLEIATWLVEAWLRTDKLAGLNAGLQFLTDLLNAFPTTLHPMSDDNEMKLAALGALSGGEGEGVLEFPLRLMTIAEGSTREFVLWEYQQALQDSKITDPAARKRKIEASGFSLEAIYQAAKATNKSFYQTTLAQLDEGLALLKTLDQTLEKLYASEAPSLRRLMEVLEETKTQLTFITNEAGYNVEPSATTTEQTPAVDETAPAASEPAAPSSNGIQTREHALKQLQAIADFFRQTEPHSPLSYMIEKAVNWGHMPLDKLLEDLIEDKNARLRVFKLAGLSTDNKLVDVPQ